MEELFLVDPLTQLYHHNYFIVRIGEEVARAKRKGTPLCLLFIDLDFFKMINDNFGHPVGDEVLKQFAISLKNAVRESDLIFRYGGDEFTIILPETSKDDAIKIAQRIKETLEDQGYGPSKNLKLSLSIGISQFPLDGVNADEILQKADERTLSSKKTGRGKIVYTSDIREETLNISLSAARIIGREKEISSFTQLLTEFKNTSKRFIALLKGVRGVGLTRLLEEISKVADILGIRTLHVTVKEKDVKEPFPLLKAMLRELIRDEHQLVLDEAQKNIVAYLIPEAFPGESLRTITISEHKVIPVVLDLLCAKKAEDKLLLNIDNGQNITKRCILQLIHILKEESARDISLIIAKTSRNMFEEELKTLYGDLYNFEILPLKREEIKTILWQILRFEPEDEFLDWIMAKTGGRPLYVDRVLNTLLLSKKLFPGETHWILSESYYSGVEDISLPLAEEITSLAPQEREVLEFCAVYNLDFSTSVIAALTELTITQVLEIFDNLTRNGYLEEIIPYNLYRFANPFVREIIYSQIPKEKRTKMHFRIARILDNNPDETARLNPQILYEHYIQGGMESKAIPYMELMVKNAIKKREFKKAIRLIQRIFEIAEYKLQISEKIRLLRELAVCLRNEGEIEDSITKLKMALELAEKYNEKYEEALVRLEIAWIQHEKYESKELFINIEEIQQIANQIKDKEILARALIYKALYYIDFENNKTKAVLTLDEVLNLVKEEENHEILAQVYGNLGKCYSQLKQNNKAKESFEIALYHARLCENPDYLASIMLNYGTTQYIMQDVESSRKTFEKTLELIRRENIRHLMPHLYSNLAMIYVNYGEYPISINYLEQALDYAKDMNLEAEALTYSAYLYGVRAYLGDHQYYESKLREVAETAKYKNYMQAWERANMYLVHIYSFLGDFTNLGKVIKNIESFRNPRSKMLAEIAVLENLVVFLKDPRKIREPLINRRREAIEKGDFTSEIGCSVASYLYYLLTGDPIEINLEKVLESSKAAKVTKCYIDAILYELVLGNASRKYLEEAKSLESHFNLKQKLLFDIASLRVELVSGEVENPVEKLDELEKKLKEVKARLLMNFLYRVAIKYFSDIDASLASSFSEKLQPLLTNQMAP